MPCRPRSAQETRTATCFLGATFTKSECPSSSIKALVVSPFLLFNTNSPYPVNLATPAGHQRNLDLLASGGTLDTKLDHEHAPAPQRSARTLMSPSLAASSPSSKKKKGQSVCLSPPLPAVSMAHASKPKRSQPNVFSTVTRRRTESGK